MGDVRPPPRWSPSELEAFCAVDRELYRERRIDTPNTIYNKEFAAAHDAVNDLLTVTADIRAIEPAMPEILQRPQLFRALRYVTCPPISEDDLKTVADVELSRRYLRSHPEAYGRIEEAVLLNLDRHFFPWVREQRAPTSPEVDKAVAATAKLIAIQRTQTSRRNKARRMEADVANALAEAGLAQVAKREVRTSSDWPRPGQFCGEGKVAGRQADLIVTLLDGRYLPVECKSSGSTVNSIKRLNNDALAKFSDWTRAFGIGQTVPVAVLEGVYDVHHVLAAQDAGATIFWRHSLDPLRDFVAAT